MLVLLFFLTFVMGQEKRDIDSSKFFIESVTVFSKYDSAFVLKLSDSVLPPNKEVTEKDVHCLLGALDHSGLFGLITMEWTDAGKGIRRLALHCEPKPGREAFVISTVSLVRLPEVDKVEFMRRMSEKGIKAGTPLIQFTYEQLNAMVDESIRQTVSPERAKEYGGSAWIVFRPDRQGEIEVRVTESSPPCSLSEPHEQ